MSTNQQEPLALSDSEKESELPLIPEDIIDSLLPSPGTSIEKMLHFPMPTIRDHTNHPLPIDQTAFGSQRSGLESALAVGALRGILVPGPLALQQLQDMVRIGIENGHQSFKYPLSINNGHQLPLPMWTITYWMRLQKVYEAQGKWEDAPAFLKSVSARFKRGQIPLSDLLARLPWEATLHQWAQVLGRTSINELARFFTRDWLSDSNAQMLTQMLSRALPSQRRSSLRLWDPLDLTKLVNIYRNHPGLYEQHSTSPLRNTGEVLENGVATVLASLVCVRIDGDSVVLPREGSGNGNHWISVVVDISDNCIWTGDSYNKSPPQELRDVLRWWLNIYKKKAEDDRQLPAPMQFDSWSCMVLAYWSLGQHLSPETFAGFGGSTPEYCDKARMRLVYQLTLDLSSVVSITYKSLVVVSSLPTM